MKAALSRWKQRIQKMEECIGIGTSQGGAEVIWFMPLLEGCDDWEDVEENSRRIRLCHGMWAVAWCGPPMSDQQIQLLKAKYAGLTLAQASDKGNQ